MAAAAKAKTTKAVNATDIAHKAERYATVKRSIAALIQEKDQDQELNATIERHAEELQPFYEKYDVEIQRLEAKADGIRGEVIEWLRKQKKAITIETKNAIAKFLKGTKPGSRVPNPQQFIARCEELGKDPWPAVSVTIKAGEPILGKTDFDTICTKENVDFEDASLELK